MTDITDRAILDIRDYLSKLQTIDKNIAKLTKSAEQDFSRIDKSIKSSGLQLGITTGLVTALATEFIKLGNQALGVLENIGEKSISLATEFDRTKASFRAIFGGSKEAADEAFNFIQDRSQKLGINLQELATVFLPKVGSLEQFEKIAKLATALQRSTPGAPEGTATIALGEALTGQFTSLQRRTNIAAGDIKKIKQAFEESGIEGLIAKLEEVLQQTGRSFDATANTAQTSFARIATSAEQVEAAIGEPIVAELKDAAGEILKFFDDNKTAIMVFAHSLGDDAVEVLKFVESFVNLKEIKAEDIITLGERIYNFVIALKTASGLVGRFVSTTGKLLGTFVQLIEDTTGIGTALEVVNPYVEAFFQHFSKGQGFTVGFLEFVAESQAGLAGLAAILGELVKSAELAGEAFGALASGDFAKAAELNTRSNEVFNNSIEAGRKATKAAYAESKKAIDDYTKSVADHADEQKRLRDRLDETNDSANEQADAILAAQEAARKADEAAADLADKEADLAAKQAKVNEQTKEAEKDFQRKLADLDIATERKRLDIAIEFAQKREDAARQNLQKLEDIQRGYAQDVDDAARDLSRKEEDIARKFGQERVDLEKENRQKRVDIEKDYRRTLQDIQRQFLLDADEAEQKRDAVAFLRALKDRNNKVQEAQLNRTREIDDQRTTNQLKLDELRLQQQRELEAARIANEQKLEDLRVNLDRQIEAQNIAYNRQLEDIATGEQRKNEELARWREQEIQDAKTAYDRKLADLKASLEAELALVEEYAAKLAEAQARATAAAQGGTTFNPRYANAIVPAGTSHGPGGRPAVTPSRTRSIYGYASGGNVPGGLPIMVGERGPELFVPAQSGAIVPNSALVGPTFSPPGMVHNISSNQSSTINLPSVGTDLLANPIFARTVRNLILGELGKI